MGTWRGKVPTLSTVYKSGLQAHLIWYFGPVQSISAVARTMNPESEVTDHIATVMDFAYGTTGVLELSWNFLREINTLDIYGDKRAIRYGVHPEGIELAKGIEPYQLFGGDRPSRERLEAPGFLLPLHSR